MQTPSIKAIITGTTGMVGEGVLRQCLLHPKVTEVLVINRRPCGVTHPKLKEIIHQDFFDLSAIENQLAGYNACYFCLGVSSIGMKEEAYYKMTYTLTLHMATMLSRHNPDMTFCYVSGSGTDSTEKGRSMWARVKGKTENDLFALPFRQVFAFRPGYLHADKDARYTQKLYKYIGWLYPVLRFVSANLASSLQELGLAMIHVTLYGSDKKILEVKDINALGSEG